MPSVEVGLLSDRIDEEEISLLQAAMEKAGVEPLPEADETAGGAVISGVDEDAITEFMDRLEGHDVAADIYLPIDFDGRIEAATMRFASLEVLVHVLEELAEDLEIDEANDAVDLEDDEEFFASEMDLMQERLRVVWRAMFDGAREAQEHGLCVFISD
jgi:hypothetical protein